MSKNTSVDIEIIVLTYNRSSLLRATLESLLAQTKPAFRICVYDNGSTDDTADMVRSLAPRGVELISRGVNHPRDCWPEMRDMARGPWTMLFHDDDLLHPDYLKDVSAALAHEPGATLAVSAMRVFYGQNSGPWWKVRGNRYRVMTGRQLTAIVYGGFPMPFCTAIYRVDVLRQGQFEIETYGKIGDRPFVLNAALAGRAVVMLDAYVHYRIHSIQDSTDQSTGPFLPEVFALQRYYRKILGEKLTDYPGFVFLKRNYRNLLGEYVRLNRNAKDPMSKEEFFRQAIASEAASAWSIRFGKVYVALMHFPRWIERKIKALIRPGK